MGPKKITEIPEGQELTGTENVYMRQGNSFVQVPMDSFLQFLAKLGGGSYLDVTQDYLAALEADGSLTGQDYLQGLPEGQYCILAPGEKYFARNVTVDADLYSEVTFYEDDGYIYRYVYISGRKCEEWESCSAYGEAVTVSARQIANNTRRIDALEAKKGAEGIVITDTSDNTRYLGQFRIVDGCPALEITKL